ncbi:MAG: recombination protein O N-terminal domain-containing protein [Sphingorhabdus sp.]
MHITASAIICAVRHHGEVGAVVRALTAEHGLLAGYVQGARGRHLRPVLIPGNLVKGEWNARVLGQLASLKVDLEHSRAHILGEPLATAAIDWITALTAATLPEAHPYPRLHSALDGVLSAIELAPAARRWAGAVAGYEELLLRELGYGEEGEADASLPVTMMARNRERLVQHMLGERRADVMAARERLVERLKRAVA